MLAKPAVQRGLYALVALLVVASIAALLTVRNRDADEPKRSEVAASSSTTTAAGDDDGDATADPSASPSDNPDGEGAVAGAAPAGPGATTPQGGPAPAGEAGKPASGDPGGVVPPKPGRYPYTSTRTTEGQPGSPATSFDVEVTTTSSSAGGEVRQTFTEKRKDAEPSQRVIWRGDSRLEDAFVVTAGDDRFECDWAPDERVLALPLRTGASWQSNATCSINTGTTVFEVKRADTARVSGTRRVAVGGTEVDVWVVERTTTDVTTRSRVETNRQDHTIEQLWAPAQGLLVREVRRSVEKTSSETIRRTDERQLQRLTPR